MSIDRHNCLTLNPFAKDGGVWMDLNSNDKLYVDASSSNQTEVWFRAGNAAELKIRVDRKGMVDF